MTLSETLGKKRLVVLLVDGRAEEGLMATFGDPLAEWRKWRKSASEGIVRLTGT
jgi:hypothetical protein